MKEDPTKDNTKKDPMKEDIRNNNKKDLYYPMTFNKY